MVVVFRSPLSKKCVCHNIIKNGVFGCVRKDPTGEFLGARQRFLGSTRAGKFLSDRQPLPTSVGLKIIYYVFNEVVTISDCMVFNGKVTGK
jgi:hypothetical protein